MKEMGVWRLTAVSSTDTVSLSSRCRIGARDPKSINLAVVFQSGTEFGLGWGGGADIFIVAGLGGMQRFFG